MPIPEQYTQLSQPLVPETHANHLNPIQTTPSNTNSTILIVEDDKPVAQQLKLLLDHLGYQIPCIVDNGEDAVRVACELQPDLILMDVMLRGPIDGIEAAGRIRREHHIAVVYITSHTSEEFLSRSEQTEPFGYLIKPCQPRELEATVRIALHHSKLERQLAAKEQHLAEAQRIGMLGSWKWDIQHNTLEWSARY